MSAPRSLARGALLASAGRLSGLLASAAVSILVARLLGPAGSGQFAVIVSLFFTLAVLTTIGLELGVAWMISSRRWDAPSALATSGAASLVLGVVGVAIGMGVRALAADSAFAGIDAVTLFIGLAGLPFAVLAQVFIQAAIAGERYEGAAMITVLQSLGYVAGVAVLASAYGLEGAAGGLLAGQLAGGVAALGWGGRTIAQGAARLSAPRLREALAFGARLFAANALWIVVYRFDIFLLNGYSGSSEAGYYAVAIAATITTLGLLPAALGSVLFPRLASLESARDEGARRELEDRAIRHTVLIVAVSAALLAALIPLLVEPIFGSRFGPAVGPALLLIPGAAALGLASTLYSALAGRGRPEFALRSAMFIGPPAIGLYFLLVPALEAEGAALGSDLAYLTSAILAAVAMRKVGGPRSMREVLPGRAELRDYRRLLSGLRGRGAPA